MNHDEIKKSLLQEFELIMYKKPEELTKDDWQKFWLWSENTELVELLPRNDSMRTLLKKLPQLEIDFVKSPINHFSKWFTEAEGKREFQKKQFIDEVISIYKSCLEFKCINKEAELVRSGLTEEYKKCIAAFEALKTEKKITDEQKNNQNIVDRIKPKNLERYKKILPLLKKGYEIEHIGYSLQKDGRTIRRWVHNMKVDFGFNTKEENFNMLVEFASANNLI